MQLGGVEFLMAALKTVLAKRCKVKQGKEVKTLAKNK